MSDRPRTSRKFQVEVIYDRQITETTYRREPVEGKPGSTVMVAEQVTRNVPESYMVYFPSGHSLWFETKEAMRQAKVFEEENVEIDLETGLPVTPPRTLDIKAVVQSKTRERRSNARAE